MAIVSRSLWSTMIIESNTTKQVFPIAHFKRACRTCIQAVHAYRPSMHTGRPCLQAAVHACRQRGCSLTILSELCPVPSLKDSCEDSCEGCVKQFEAFICFKKSPTLIETQGAAISTIKTPPAFIRPCPSLASFLRRLIFSSASSYHPHPFHAKTHQETNC